MWRRILLAFVMMLSVCIADAAGLMDKLGWMYGLYEQHMGTMVLYENWVEVDGDHWRGLGGAVNKKGDTIFREQLQLLQENDTVWYIATVANQNGGQPVKFRAVTLSDSLAVFSNPQHDFPQQIIYMPTEKGISVIIEGVSRKGKTRREYFEFSSVKK